MPTWKKYIAPSALVCLLPTTAYSAQYLTVKEAQALSFPTATSFEPANVMFTPEQAARIQAESGIAVQVKGQQIWRALQGQQLIGYVVADYSIGKHLAIDYMIALSTDGTCKRVEILEYRESYGGEIKNRDWLKQFEGKTKDSKLTLNDDIINIGGATLSSRHVTEGVKRVLATFDVITHPVTPRS